MNSSGDPGPRVGETGIGGLPTPGEMGGQASLLPPTTSIVGAGRPARSEEIPRAPGSNAGATAAPPGSGVQRRKPASLPPPSADFSPGQGGERAAQGGAAGVEAGGENLGVVGGEGGRGSASPAPPPSSALNSLMGADLQLSASYHTAKEGSDAEEDKGKVDNKGSVEDEGPEEDEGSAAASAGEAAARARNPKWRLARRWRPSKSRPPRLRLKGDPSLGLPSLRLQLLLLQPLGVHPRGCTMPKVGVVRARGAAQDHGRWRCWRMTWRT